MKYKTLEEAIDSVLWTLPLSEVDKDYFVKRVAEEVNTFLDEQAGLTE